MGLTKPRAHQLQGSDYKASVRVVTTSNVNLSGGAPTSVDGVTLVANDRVLVTGQSTGSQNGIYRVKTLGTGSNGTWVRSKDADTNDDVTAGIVVMVTEGSSNADKQFKLTTNDAITVGTTSLTFTERKDDTSVAGSDTQVQFNDGGSLAGDSGLVFAKATDALTVTGNITGGNLITSALMDSATIHTSGLATLHSATVEDLTDNQVVVATTGGRLANTNKLTFDETTLAVTGAATVSTTLGVTGLSTLATATVSDLTDDQVVVATTGGRLANTNKLTFDESTLAVTGAITASTTITGTGNVTGSNLVTAGVADSATIHTSGLATLHSATVEDLTDDQVVVATTGGRLANTNKLTFNETTLAITGALTASTTAVVTGNITGGNLITAALMDSATIHTSGLATLHSATVEDLTDDQVVVATTGGRLANTNKLTFDESTFAVTGALTVSGESTLASAIVSDLTDNRVVIAGTSGAIEDDANFTFDGTTLGLGTTGTGDLILLTATEDSATASPVITLKRNSSSPADADYLGQIKFKGENDADQEVVYAKMTGKILDASDGTEDGIIEFNHIKAGSGTITGRFRSDSYQLLNGTTLTVNGLISTDATVTATGNITGGNIISSGRMDSSNGGAFRWFDSDGSHYFELKAAGTTTANKSYQWPSTDGSNGQVLTTNGAAALSWADSGSGGAGGFTDSTITVHPAADGDESLGTGPNDDTEETPFEAGGTDAFGVSLGSVYDQMEPTGSTSTIDLGAFT